MNEQINKIQEILFYVLIRRLFNFFAVYPPPAHFNRCLIIRFSVLSDGKYICDTAKLNAFTNNGQNNPYKCFY